MKKSPQPGKAQTPVPGATTAQNIDFTQLNLGRLAHNYLGESTTDQVNLLAGFINHFLDPTKRDLPKYKVGLMFICINEPYWPYIQPVVQDARNLFLPGHDVEIMLWSDIPEDKPEVQGVTVFPVDSVGWPYPTLMRYHIMLNQEEYLKKFDYIFYLDTDMRIVNVVGDEILSDLTAAQHPMYALNRMFIPPYEPNPDSASFIPRPGRVVVEQGKPRFEPLYFAGGFQGGKTQNFIDAMKGTKAIIDSDLNQNYIPIWNDESAWNKYLFSTQPTQVLSPAYIYPDSMINEYYVRIWGRNYTPRIVTLTKPFTVSKEGGAAAQEMMGKLNGL